MATNQTVMYKFDWGEPVKVIDNAPEKYWRLARVVFVRIGK